MARDKRTTGMEAIASRTSAYAVHIDYIAFQEGFLMREEINREQVESLKRQIIEYIVETKTQHPKPYGVHTPITGFYQDMKFMLNHGHHRVTAVKEMATDGTLDRLVAEGKITSEDIERIVNIPATRVAPPIGKDEASTKRAQALLYLRQITDNSGRNYSPLECAKTCYKVLNEYGLSQTEIAAILGKTPGTISNWLKILEIPEEVQDNVAEGTIALSYVNELVREHGEPKAVEIIQKAIEKAKQNGEKKVTKKDVDPTRLTKKQIKELLATVKQRPLENGKIEIDFKVWEAVQNYINS